MVGSGERVADDPQSVGSKPNDVRSIRRVTDGFDIVAVEVEDERGVIVLVILRPQPERAVALSAVGHRGVMKGVDLRPGRDLEGDMKPPPCAPPSPTQKNGA